MARISMAMLRRALAEMADRTVGRGMMSDAGEAGANMLRAGGSGASLGALGGVAMNAPDDSRNEDLYGYSDRLMRGIGTGALVGAGLGAGAVGFMGARGAASALRRALAEAAAERGLGRAATRDMGHVEDAVRFHTANEGDDVAMRGRHAEPDAVEPDADVDDAITQPYRAPNTVGEDLYERMPDAGMRSGVNAVLEKLAPNLSPVQRRILSTARGVDDIAPLMHRMGFSEADIRQMLGL